LKHVPHSRWADAIFVSTPFLYDFVPRSAVLVPQAISVDSLEKYIPSKKQYRDGIRDPVVITHAIHSEEARGHKGSDIIIDAIKKLKARGLKIDFRFYIGEKHDLVLNEIAQADIHIDQMYYGWHGTISVEAMAIGTPVVCYIRPDLEEFGESLPIVRADKTNLIEQLESLIQNVKLRKRLSSEGEIYVSKFHDVHQVAKKMLDIYTN